MLYTRETVEALIRAFNVNNRFSDTIETNFILQSHGEKDYLVVLFDKDMDRYQCDRYLDSIKRKIIGDFYQIEEDNDKEILDTAKLIFDIKSFPFNISKGKLLRDKQHRFKFSIRVDKGVVFNLKSHLASSIKKDVLEDMSICSVFTNAFNKKEYLWHGKFGNKELCEQFKDMFLSRYPNKLLKVKSSDVYIRNIFDDVCLIDSITQRNTLFIGRSLQASSKDRSDVKAFKDLIIEFINQSTGLIVIGFMCAPPLKGKGASILIPVILDSEGPRALTNEEALRINDVFYGIAFSDVDGKTNAELSVNGSSGIYGIDFYNRQVSYCVVTKIIESSVINKDHRLTIDPKLFVRSLSRSPSTEMLGAELESPRQGSGQGAKKETEVFSFLHHNVNSSHQSPQQSLSAAAVGADESSRSGECSKAKSEEDRVSSKSESKSPKKHGGGWFRKKGSKSNSSSGSNTPSEPLEPIVPSTDDRAEGESSKKKQNLFQMKWCRFFGDSNEFSEEGSPVYSLSNDNIGWSAETPAPFERNDKVRCSMISSISDPAGHTNKKSLHFRRSSIPDEGLEADKLLGSASIKNEFSRLLQSKSGPSSMDTSGYDSMSSSLESVDSDNDPTLSNTLGRTISGFLPQLKLKDGLVYVPKLKQKDAVKAKKQILEYFIRYLVFMDDKESERTEMLRLLSTPEGIEKLYSVFFSSYKREQLCSKLLLSSDNGKHLVEFVWSALHYIYVKRLYLDSVVGAFDQSRHPGKFDGFSGKSSKKGSPDTSGGIKKQSPFVPCSQTELTGPSSSSATQYTGARKKVNNESDICPTNPLAVLGTAAFVPVSVLHVKSNIDELEKNFLTTIEVAKEEKFGSSEPEHVHQWLDKERRRCSTKQAKEEESISSWVWR
ncbi:hypothetical protein [Wolbachia endosymbiont of Tettigetta isshikii]|uniref:hypothetical protein n=1 Tax=Wolbachia endosymbiont of Tettigetta isshikii TaxID=3239093 RepID=UPI00397EC27A